MGHAVNHQDFNARYYMVAVADLEGVPWVPWNPPFCRQLEDQPAHGTVFSREI